MDRLEAIVNYKKNKDNEALLKIQEEQKKTEQFRKKIESLKPRIDMLIPSEGKRAFSEEGRTAAASFSKTH